MLHGYSIRSWICFFIAARECIFIAMVGQIDGINDALYYKHISPKHAVAEFARLRENVASEVKGKKYQALCYEVLDDYIIEASRSARFAEWDEILYTK